VYIKVLVAALNSILDLLWLGLCLGQQEVVVGGDQQQGCVGQELCRSLCPSAPGLSQKQGGD